MSRQLFLIAGDDVIWLFTCMLSVVFLARFFIAGCTTIDLSSDNFQCGWWWENHRNDGFFLSFPFGEHVQCMERSYVCVLVYIKTISLHKVIYTKLFVCYKAGVYSKE